MFTEYLKMLGQIRSTHGRKVVGIVLNTQ